MAALAEDSIQPAGTGRRLLVGLAVLAALAAVLALGWWLKNSLSQPAAQRHQAARIALLPDTPPPPPPPPRDEPKPQARDDKPPPPDAAPKPQAAPVPADAPLKMEGAAGDAPSAFAAGKVSQDFQGGIPGSAAASGGTGVNSDRAQDRFYAQSARQLLRDEIERHLRSEAGELSASFSLWVARDGSIARSEIVPSGNARQDDELRAALDLAGKTLRLPQPPAALTQPMRFRLTVRAQG
jgi:outer membrane biosynthesis protein TonB